MRYLLKFTVLCLVLILNSCSDQDENKNEGKLSNLFSFTIKIDGKNIDKDTNQYDVKFESLDGINPNIQGEEFSFAGNADNTTYIYFRLFPYGGYPRYPELLEKSLVRKIKFTLYENNKVLMSKVVTTSAKKIVNKNGYQWFEITKLEIDGLDCLDKIKNSTIALNLYEWSKNN